MPRFHSYCLPFQSEGNYAFVTFVNTANSMGRRRMKKNYAASSLLAPKCRKYGTGVNCVWCYRGIFKSLLCNQWNLRGVRTCIMVSSDLPNCPSSKPISHW